jgi:DNA-binding NtrC family response regulator
MMPLHEEPAPDTTPSPSSGQRVLLVDEDEHDLRHFTMLLEQMDFSVWAFTDYREAERFLAQGNFDLVIVGQGGSDLETCRLAQFTLGRELYAPVVVLTRSLEIKGYVRAMQLGASEYLEKTLTPAEFKRVVLTHSQSRQAEKSASATCKLDPCRRPTWVNGTSGGAALGPHAKTQDGP